MFDSDLRLRSWMFDVRCLPRRSLAKAGSTCLPRIRERSEENEANDVRAGRAFVARERFGSRANSANARDSRFFAEFCSTTFQARRATNSGRESPRQKAFVGSTA